MIESEPQCAAAIEASLAPYAVEVELAKDGESGTAAAKRALPDLVVLTVELSDDNGYLVGRRLKRSQRLAQVPMIILSNDENADSLFEQHQKTKSRAEHYLHKPVDSEVLVGRIKDLVPLELRGATEIETEGEHAMSDDEMQTEAPASAGAPTEIDDEIDAFAEDAFDALMLDGGKQNSAEDASDAEPETVAPGASSEPTTGEYEDVEIDDVIMVSEASSAETVKPSSVAPVAPVGSIRPPPSEGSLGPVEVARLRSEISELKAKLAESSGGVSSRQFLDLRETLNTKDKEILDLRDQLTVRDKAIIELRDQSIAHERAKADFDEKVAGLERSLSKAQESIASLTEDKEAANKRFEDVKARFEREHQKARGLEDSLAEEREGRAAEVTGLKSAHDAELARTTLAHEEAMELAKAESAAALAKSHEDREAALQAAAADKETALGSLRSELEDERGAALAQASAEAEAAKQGALAAQREHLETEAASQVAEVESAWKRTLAEREAALQGEKESEIEALHSEHSKQLATLGRKLADTETELTGAREREQLNAERGVELETKLAEVQSALATASSDLTETRDHRDRLQSELEDTQRTRDGLDQELNAAKERVQSLEGTKQDLESRIGSLEAVKGQLETKLSDAMEKIATDDALLERVRKAMAIGLSLLEEQRNNAVGGSDSEREGVSGDAE